MEPSKCQIPAEEPEGERSFEVWGLENGDVVLDRQGWGGPDLYEPAPSWPGSRAVVAGPLLPELPAGTRQAGGRGLGLSRTLDTQSCVKYQVTAYVPMEYLV